MWVTLNNAFVSIVEHRDDPDLLIVRARVEGDIERFFCRYPDRPAVEVNEAADYRFRVTVKREAVEDAMVAAVRRITYPNFKDSIKAAWRSGLAMRVWSIWHGEQVRRYGPRPSINEQEALL